jgi:hypothetical protein
MVAYVETLIKNPRFLERKVSFFQVERKKNQILISGVFNAPPDQNFKGKEKFEVTVRVDWANPSCRREPLKISSHELMASKKVASPTYLDARGYPWNKVQSWKNSQGDTFLKWITGLSSSELVRPTDLNINGGISPWKKSLKKQGMDIEREKMKGKDKK